MERPRISRNSLVSLRDGYDEDDIDTSDFAITQADVHESALSKTDVEEAASSSLSVSTTLDTES